MVTAGSSLNRNVQHKSEQDRKIIYFFVLLILSPHTICKQCLSIVFSSRNMYIILYSLKMQAKYKYYYFLSSVAVNLMFLWKQLNCILLLLVIYIFRPQEVNDQRTDTYNHPLRIKSCTSLCLLFQSQLRNVMVS